MKAVVLLSGGMDSSTLMYYVKYILDREPIALTFKYGQKAQEKELECAKKLCEIIGAEHHVFDISDIFGYFLSAILKGKNIPIPGGEVRGIPPTYVPYRNTILLSLACGFAESHDISEVYYAANEVDYSGYPDCRLDYIIMFNELSRKAARNPVNVYAPLAGFAKWQIVKLGEKLHVPWKYTWSCYRSGPTPCGRCPSCKLRAEAFRKAGVRDEAVELH